jgi:hypothetical protein
MSTEETETTTEEYDTAMEKLLNETSMDELGGTISGVLEFLTVRALQDGPYYIMTDDKKAICVLATNEDCDALVKVLPENFVDWESYVNTPSEPVVITNRDLGDEQDGSTE